MMVDSLCRRLTTLLLWSFFLLGPISAQVFGTMCTGRRFRRLSLKLQNEHQCLQMEQIQSEALLEQTDRRRRHRELLEYSFYYQLAFMTALDAKVDHLISDLSDNVGVWEEKWTRKLKEARAQLAQSTMYAAARTPTIEDESGDSDSKGCSGGVCPGDNVFVANLDMRPIPRDCSEWQAAGMTTDGVFPIMLPGAHVVLVYCDMTTDNGGWTVFQRRQDGSVSFNRNWIQYREGFGNPNTEFWMGNENLHQLTSSKNYTLLINMWDWEDEDAYAYYRNFRVESEAENYRLLLGKYHGVAGDSLSYHRGMNFSTPDRDHDTWLGSCARKDRAGWWFRDCGFATLNSQYHDLYNSAGPSSLRDGVLWYHWRRDSSQSLQRVEMKIRPTPQQ